MNVVWKHHPKYSTFQVSSCGKIRNWLTGNILKPEVNERGYLRVATRIEGRRKNLKVHRMVAETWLENPMKLSDVDHKSRNKQDNSVLNLEWTSHQENVERYVKMKNSAV